MEANRFKRASLLMLKNVCSSIGYRFNKLNDPDVDGFLGL